MGLLVVWGGVGGRRYPLAMLRSERFTGTGVKVRPGARDRHGSNLERLTFAFWAVCDSVDPEAWHGEVVFGSVTLLKTDSVPDEHQAGRLAERALEARLLAVLGGND